MDTVFATITVKGCATRYMVLRFFRAAFIMTRTTVAGENSEYYSEVYHAKKGEAAWPRPVRGTQVACGLHRLADVLQAHALQPHRLVGRAREGRQGLGDFLHDVLRPFVGHRMAQAGRDGRQHLPTRLAVDLV